MHPFGQLKNLGPFVTDKKTRVLLLISKASWQEDILEILKVTVIRTPGVKTQLILKTGTQTWRKWDQIKLKRKKNKKKTLNQR